MIRWYDEVRLTLCNVYLIVWRMILAGGTADVLDWRKYIKLWITSKYIVAESYRMVLLRQCINVWCITGEKTGRLYQVRSLRMRAVCGEAGQQLAGRVKAALLSRLARIFPPHSGLPCNKSSQCPASAAASPVIHANKTSPVSNIWRNPRQKSLWYVSFLLLS